MAIMKLQIKFLLMCGCILHALTEKGAFGVSSSAPLNRVVYEGATNTTIKCKSKESFMDWAIIPYPSIGSTRGKLFTRNGKIISPFNESFAVDHTQGTDDHTLVIYNATISPSGRAKISTTGFYQCRTNTTFTAAQLVVVRNDPICSSDLTQSTASCTIVYGGYREFPIDAVMNWTVNGQPIPSGDAKLTINATPTEINATSTIVINPNSDATYECATKFSKTANNRFPDVANNAPDYYKTCTTSIGCGDTVHTGSHGYVSSPYYPSNYGDNQNCTNIIWTSQRSSFAINFQSMSMEGCCDYVELSCLDNASFGSHRFTGSTIPPKLDIPGCTQVVVWFYSDYSNVQTGFNLEYLVTPEQGELVAV